MSKPTYSAYIADCRYLTYGYMDYIEYKDRYYMSNRTGASYLIRVCLNLW